MSRVVGVVQGRMGSTRLPGKLLAPVAGHPLLEVLATRLRPAQVDAWWLATSDLPADDVAAAWGEALGMRVLRGDAEDVLSRFAAVAAQSGARWIVRVTGDDPFVDAAVVNQVVAATETADESVSVVGEPAPRSTPLGYVPEAARADRIVELAGRPDLEPHHRAHVTSALRAVTPAGTVTLPGDWPDRAEWRWTVDTKDDLEVTDRAFRAFRDEWPTIGYRDMVAILDRHPTITSHNAGVRQKELEAG